MKELCRNCQSQKVTNVNRGALAPFFLKRVFGIYLNSLEDIINLKMYYSNSHIKKFLLSSLLKALVKFRYGREWLKSRPDARVNIRVCNSCGFVGPEFNYTYDLLSNLYRDYRSENYNKERVSLEPSYEKIKLLVGKSKEELIVRTDNLDALIREYVDVSQIKNIVDWGGGEGKFIPSDLQNKEVWILDVSNEPLVNSKYYRVSQVPDNIKFDYAQVCHVLEHVLSPYDFMVQVLIHVNIGGYIYIELPQDRSDEEIERFKDVNSDIIHSIHEHINLYNTTSLAALAHALGLRVITIQTRLVDFGWVSGEIISGLFLKQ